MNWRPLSARSGPSSADAYEVLHDGVPPWLTSGVVDWLRQVLHRDVPYGQDGNEGLRALEQILRFPLDWRYGALDTLIAEIESDGERALDIVDAALMITSSRSGASERQSSLDFALRIGGSLWRVSTTPGGTPCLERRVDETAHDAALAELATAGNPARHLGEAWHQTYGRQPSPSGAYREAVRAVEAAAKPIIAPSDPLATLGKMIRAIRDKPEKWVWELGEPTDVADMLAHLWTSQLDRHGTDDETHPLTVSIEQAEAAVHLAVSLVHWCRSGAFRPA